jgi:hypothetical protein
LSSYRSVSRPPRRLSAPAPGLLPSIPGPDWDRIRSPISDHRPLLTISIPVIVTVVVDEQGAPTRGSVLAGPRCPFRPVRRPVSLGRVGPIKAAHRGAERVMVRPVVGAEPLEVVGGGPLAGAGGPLGERPIHRLGVVALLAGGVA